MSRKALSEVEEQGLVERYLGGAGQVILSRTFGIARSTVWNILERRGVVQRKNEPKVNPVLVRELYDSGLSQEEVGRFVGLTQSAVKNYLKRDGGSRPRNTRKHEHDTGFFDKFTRESCYWAGFLAADGNVFDGSRVWVTVTLARRDGEHLEGFRRCASIEKPVKPITQSGRPYSRLTISGREWADALGRNFGVVPRKCRRLRPPDKISGRLVWHFIRGYFDGDGHPAKDKDAAQFTTGSRPFLEWIVKMAKSHHSIYEINGSWGVYICGPVMRAMVKKMYQGSTPDTRLERKYRRLLQHL